MLQICSSGSGFQPLECGILVLMMADGQRSSPLKGWSLARPTKWRKFTEEAHGSTFGLGDDVPDVSADTEPMQLMQLPREMSCFAVKCKWAGGIVDMGKSRPEVTATNEKCVLPSREDMISICRFHPGSSPNAISKCCKCAQGESCAVFSFIKKHTHSLAHKLVKNGWWENVAASSWPSHVGKINCF